MGVFTVQFSAGVRFQSSFTECVS